MHLMQTLTYSQDAIFIGLMSGTSVDAIDAVAVSFGKQSVRIHGSYSHEIPDDLRALIIELNTPSENELHKSMRLDQRLGELFADTVQALLKKAQLDPKQICAIGSHGQTIRHQIDTPPFYTLQVGNPNIIAERTGICTVADFRTRDMVMGGQGAPLVPAFHQDLFQSSNERIILNIGGMANLTILSGDEKTIGFDTGPGNVLLDMWISLQKGERFDKDGDWAKSGRVNQNLLEDFLEEQFFHRAPPKSTGRDLFNADWFNKKVANIKEKPENIQATLLALTVESIALSIESIGKNSGELYVCGGGALNTYLMSQLDNRLKDYSVDSTATLGLDPLWVEACAFAWLARQTLTGKTGNLPSVTGAEKPLILGSVYPIETTP